MSDFHGDHRIDPDNRRCVRCGKGELEIKLSKDKTCNPLGRFSSEELEEELQRRAKGKPRIVVPELPFGDLDR